MEPNQVKEWIQAVIDGLTPLTQKLQVPIEHLWAWGIRHNYAVAVSDTAIAIGLISYVVAVYEYIRWGIANKFNKDEALAVAGVFACVGCVPAVVIAYISLNGAIIRAIAPEWSTARDLVSLIRGN